MPLMCPAVLTFVWENWGRHTLMVSFGIFGDEAGNALVSLRIDARWSRWSGWHGRVTFGPGCINILVNHRGDSARLRDVRLVAFDTARRDLKLIREQIFVPGGAAVNKIQQISVPGSGGWIHFFSTFLCVKS